MVLPPFCSVGPLLLLLCKGTSIQNARDPSSVRGIVRLLASVRAKACGRVASMQGVPKRGGAGLFWHRAGDTSIWVCCTPAWGWDVGGNGSASVWMIKGRGTLTGALAVVVWAECGSKL